MGERGPIGNRSDDLARPRSRKGGDQGPAVKNGVMRPVTIPDTPAEWHDIAVMVWEALIDSGQSDFYQQTDWAFAYSLCDDLTHYKNGGRWNRKTGEFEPYRSPEMLKAIQSAMASLLMTEGDRRRVRVELTAPASEQAPASVVALASYRDELGMNDTDTDDTDDDTEADSD